MLAFARQRRRHRSDSGGTLLLIGGTGGRRIRPGSAIVSAVTAAMPALTAGLALVLAPIRVNPIVHVMINASVTGATYDIDGGQQFVA